MNLEINNNSYSKGLLKAAALLGLIYLFLLSITLIGDSFKLMGKGVAETLIQTTSNPFIGLIIGVFTTSLVQSSSLTTSLVVGMVAAKALTIPVAIPIVMGANIGTSVTNLLVSIGHIRRAKEFERAFRAAIVHDCFNVLSVIFIFPLQYYFNVIGISAGFVAKYFENVGGLRLINPLAAVLKPGLLTNPEQVFISELKVSRRKPRNYLYTMASAQKPSVKSNGAKKYQG